MKDKKYPRDGEGIVKCRACAADIFFEKIGEGRFVPVDPDTETSHFLTCPNANDFSASRKRKE